MAKRIFRREDEGRTELLGQAELFVQKGKAVIPTITLGCMIRKLSTALAVEAMR